MAREASPRGVVVAVNASIFHRPSDAAARAVWDIAAAVPDPEVPVLTIEDLGVLREATIDVGRVRVTLTPTYSGCPAIDQMRDDVKARLREAGYTNVQVDYTLTPAWTTDWMSEAGKQKLEEYGIAPPSGLAAARQGPIPVSLGVKCPRCGSLRTHEVSRFGSTSCKAFYECLACLEPFDYFKVH